jgi:hypothetical protein
MMSKNEGEFHRKIAIRCFNETWDYLEKKARTEQDNQRMLQHALRERTAFCPTCTLLVRHRMCARTV